MSQLTRPVLSLFAFTLFSLSPQLFYFALADNDTSAAQTVSRPRIRQIQGTTHLSPMRDKSVAGVQGVVTATSTDSFYFEDSDPDDDNRTSEALLVFSRGVAANVRSGDLVSVDGVVSEFRPGNNAPTNANLTITQLRASSVKVISSGNSLPTPIVIGKEGRIPPGDLIFEGTEGDIETKGDLLPNLNGIDFYESLEGMRVQLDNAVVIGPTFRNRQGKAEIPVLADNGGRAGLRTRRGGIVVRSMDFNPERIFLSGELVNLPDANVSDRFSGRITGVVDYSFGNYKLLVTEAPKFVSGNLSREVSKAAGTGQISIATFNVENLDPGDSPDKIRRLAEIIVKNLRSPDIIAVEEIQDNNGATNDEVVDAAETFNTLIAAVQSAGGPTYSFRNINPIDDKDGGEPGGNIRVGFLFRTDRGLRLVDQPGGTPADPVSAIKGPDGAHLSFSPGRIDPGNPVFSNSRKPLAGEFIIGGKKLFVIANHLTAKGGDQPLFGRFQPPARPSDKRRADQALVIANFVGSILNIEPNANVVVLGDMNDFEFAASVKILKDARLKDLIETLPQNERYTYVFEGNSQTLDHILVSPELAKRLSMFDVVHINSEFTVNASDHDPNIAIFNLN